MTGNSYRRIKTIPRESRGAITYGPGYNNLLTLYKDGHFMVITGIWVYDCFFQ